MKSFLPVDDGKNIPTRRVKEVAISADTYRPKFSMDPGTSTEARLVFSRICPLSR